jgi:RNase H-like domain found in reverse transcriptase
VKYILSKKLTETEQRYSSQERELLAAKYALEHWRYIIERSKIITRTDHESLENYWSKYPMTKRLTRDRFLGDIEHFDPTFQYRPGPLQIVPDALSRMPGSQEGEPADMQQFTAIENEPAAEQPQNQGSQFDDPTIILPPSIDPFRLGIEPIRIERLDEVSD